MDPQNTDLVIMLYESLSMRSREKAARMQMEAILRRQNKRQEQCRVSVLLADAECRLLYDRVPIEVVHPPTKDGKRTGEASELRDAILKGIRYVERNQHDLKDEKHASKVVFQIIRIGNASVDDALASDLLLHSSHVIAWGVILDFDISP